MILARASARTNFIILMHKCFLFHISIITRAFIVYIRPLLEYALCVWHPDLIKYVKAHLIGPGRFTKRPPNMSNANQVRALGLETLQHRRLQQDCDKLSTDHTNMFCVRLPYSCHSIALCIL